MMNLAALLSVALFSGGGSPTDSTRADEFRGWFASAAEGSLQIPEPVVQRAAQLRYVFIGGLGGERMPGMFVQNGRDLRALGVPKSAIHTYRPSSGKTVEENRGDVRDEILKIAALGPEKLVLIGHSRGACDALAFALNEHDFVSDHVEAMFLIQGPFGGSGLADYVMGEGEAMDKTMPAYSRFVARLLAIRERALVASGYHAGLAGLTRNASQSYWKAMLAEHASAIAIVGPKAFFIATQAEPSQLRLFQRVMNRYLGAYYGKNDGLVCVDDQFLPGIGTRLGVLDAGHADLTRRFPATKAGRKTRRALIQSLVMELDRVGTPEISSVH